MNDEDDGEILVEFPVIFMFKFRDIEKYTSCTCHRLSVWR